MLRMKIIVGLLLAFLAFGWGGYFLAVGRVAGWFGYSGTALTIWQGCAWAALSGGFLGMIRALTLFWSTDFSAQPGISFGWLTKFIPKPNYDYANPDDAVSRYIARRDAGRTGLAEIAEAEANCDDEDHPVAANPLASRLARRSSAAPLAPTGRPAFGRKSF